MTDILDQSLRASPDAAESAVGDETVLLHLLNGTYYGLDRLGTQVWSMLKNRMDPRSICLSLAESYGVDVEEVETDVRTFLSDLMTQGILLRD